jgi:hypothetical protein
MPGITDLPNLINVQQQYISDIAKLPNTSDAGTPSRATTNLQAVRDTNNTLKTSISLASDNVAKTITNQNDMLNIVNLENKRLTDKKAQVDTALQSQQRAISLNDSYRQRYAQYINIIIVIVVCLIMMIAVNMLGNLFTSVPSFIFDIVIFVIFIVGVYLCYSIFIQINRRSKMDFSKLDIQGLNIQGNAAVVAAQTKAASIGDLLGTINLDYCVGSDCCSDGTYWDSGNAVCLPGTAPASFTTLAITYKTGEIGPNVSPNSPNELDAYTFYK